MEITGLKAEEPGTSCPSAEVTVSDQSCAETPASLAQWALGVIAILPVLSGFMKHLLVEQPDSLFPALCVAMVGHAALVSENSTDCTQGAREQPLMSCLQMLSSSVWSLVLRRQEVPSCRVDFSGERREELTLMFAFHIQHA